MTNIVNVNLMNVNVKNVNVNVKNANVNVKMIADMVTYSIVLMFFRLLMSMSFYTDGDGYGRDDYGRDDFDGDFF